MRPPRIVNPEWLDQLPPDDVQAVRSRRDLVLLNAIMGHPRLIARALRRSLPSRSASLADIGCGDGHLMLTLARRLAHWFPNASVALVDRQNTVPSSTIAGFNAVGWNAKTIVADVFDWLLEPAQVDAIISNLFLHHFESSTINRLLSLAAQKTRVLIACEPRRSRFTYWASCSLRIIGAGPVTRNDAPISVLAGFADRELTNLWPADGWRCGEAAAGLFSHLFVAQKYA